MLSQFWPKLIAASFALILCVAVVLAWRADRRDRAQLAAKLAVTQQLLTAADARQRDRDAQLAQTLSAIAEQKRDVVTPAQIIAELAKSIPLPAPIALHPYNSSSGVALSIAPHTSSRAPEKATQASPSPNAGATQTPGSSLLQQATPASKNVEQAPTGGAIIPLADLKPLYDFTLDCQACQAKLSTAQNDLADEKAKTAALTKERDDAIRVAKGGGAWRRFARAAKWLAIGAAAGAIASKSFR